MLTVTRHTALDAVRKRTRHATAPLDTAEALPTPPDAHEEFSALWDLLAVLSPEERELVVLRLYHGLSHGEIAETLRISTAAAQKRYHRAIDKLRAHHGVPQPTSTATKGDRHEDE